MARLITYGWLFVIAPVHFGMGLTAVHPALNHTDYFPLACAGSLVMFAAVAIGTRQDPQDNSWRCCGRLLLWFYALPMAALAAAHTIAVLPTGEPIRLVRELRPDPEARPPAPAWETSLGDLPRNRPPASPWPFLRRFAGLLAAALSASARYLAALAAATPGWVWLLALAFGSLRSLR